MKKMLSGACAAVLAATPSMTYATLHVNAQPPKDNFIEQANQDIVTGKLELDINFPTPIHDSHELGIKVNLMKGSTLIGTIPLGEKDTGNFENGVSYSIEKLDFARIPITDSDISFIRIVFDHVERGVYHLQLTGDGYASANISDIDISTYSKRIRIGTSENTVTTKDASGKEKTQVYKGGFLAGDVNTDSIIDMEDYQVVLADTLSNAHTSGYDINKDKKVNVSDLSILLMNQGKVNTVLTDKDYENTDAILDPTKVLLEVPADLTVNGDLKNLLIDNTSTVSIGKPNESPSKEDPIKVKIDLSNTSDTSKETSNASIDMEQIVISCPTITTNENAGPLEEGSIQYTQADGTIGTLAFSASNAVTKNTKNGDSQDIVIDLGKQIAVKEITIDVTKNRGNKNLSEISKIEFLNNVYKELPKPEMNIPQIRTVETSTALHDERITLTWDPQPNVTGYEVKYQKLDENNKVQWTKTLQTNTNALNILDKAIKPYDLFRVSIQSLNGDWKSGYANELSEGQDNGYWTGANPFDGKADNVDENFNPRGDYYTNNTPSDKGTISEIRVVPLSAPTKPINLSTTPGYKSFSVSWENHTHARDFDIYYRPVGTTGDVWLKANDNNIEVKEHSEAMTKPDKSKLSRSHSYTVNGLLDNVTYEIRVTATNHLGTSPMSETYLVTTDHLIPPVSSNYKLINRPTTDGIIGTSNIIDVKNANNAVIDSIYAAVDNNYGTSYVIRDWDSGIYGKNGPLITFDKEYAIGSITMTMKLEKGNYSFPYNVNIRSYTEDGTMQDVSAMIHKKVSNGKEYAILTFPKPITAKKISVNPSVYPGGYVSISELKFHEYDSLEDEVKDLFTDNLRVKLKDTVTQEQIDTLVKRAKTMDFINQEYHPNLRNILGLKTDTDPKYQELGDNTYLGLAQKLLSEVNISKKITTLDSTIRNGNSANIGMNNDWQSLGAVARPGKDASGNGKEIVVYMGSNNANAEVEITFLQSYGQPGSFMSRTTTIKPGRTTIPIPYIFNADVEKGGVVMARIKRGGTNDTIQLRLSGVTQIPSLNVHTLINDPSKVAETKDVIRTYIQDLKQYVKDLPNRYPDSVSPTDKIDNIYLYDPNTSALDSTDIEGDRFTLTFPASQILNEVQTRIVNNEDAQVERVYNALLAWEQEMQYAFAKKGVYETLNDFNGSGEIDEEDRAHYKTNRAPQNRINIKYQRMVMGAAGYASSHHVGVMGANGLLQGVPYEFNENGQVTNPETGKLYGDLIGHEIGHVLDVNGRIYDETSNNLMTSLMRTIDDITPSSVEGSYDKLYEKVTSNTKGLSTNRNVVLGMLWQLRLAYENNYTSQMIFTDNDNDPANDSFFAKWNRAYRTRLAGESSNDKNQTLIRVTSRVVEKDLTDFFLAHGITPDTDTYQYIQKNGWPKEERKIQYLNDEARRKRLSGIQAMEADTALVANFGKDADGLQVKEGSYVNQKSVPIHLSVSKDHDKILGYEILRNGIPCGFTLANGKSSISYHDVIDTINNQTFTYSVVAYDYLLNKTKEVALGTVKVRHDGSISNKSLSVSTNTIDAHKTADTHGENESAKLMLDTDPKTSYTGRMMTQEEYSSLPNKVESLKPGTNPYVIVDTNAVNTLAGIQYTAPVNTSKILRTKSIDEHAIQKYELQVSKDGTTWTKVKEGTITLDPNNPTTTIYFDKTAQGGGKQLATHNARFVKVIAKGVTTLSVAELKIIAPPGDNIEIGVSSDNQTYKNGIGLLKETYTYVTDDPNTAENEEKSIPKGSIIITGEYRGNPAFNVPLVLNQNDEHIADVYKGILLAEIPNSGDLGEISEGNWIYWVTPENSGNFLTENKEIFAELYRTDTADAQDGGQRMVSNTFYIPVPDELLEISLEGKTQKTSSSTRKAIEIDSSLIAKVNSNR